MIILKTPITVSYEGKKGSSQYRAILDQPHDSPMISIQQQIKGEWSSIGDAWHLRTLIKDRIRANDSVMIDDGQKWIVTKGMKQVINEAFFIGCEIVKVD